MGKINMGRVILGGIICGVITDVLGDLLDAVILGHSWADGMAKLGHAQFSFNFTQTLWLTGLGFVTALAAIWLYAAIRPRFGAGPKTAALAGVFVAFVTNVVADMRLLYVPHLFSGWLILYSAGGGVVIMVLGTMAGASVYREDGDATPTAAATHEKAQAAGV